MSPEGTLFSVPACPASVPGQNPAFPGAEKEHRGSDGLSRTGGTGGMG